ncbi:MAG: hypothetical protein KDC09_00405 [Bacteroidales bacterium]|nr:hypothetical protein [Bacteroidales bacterium]
MKSSFTLDDLFLFAFNETHETNESMVGHDFEVDEMKNELKELLGHEFKTEEESIAPSKRVISNIMSYSRALNVVRTKQAGNINLLMN